MMSLSIQGVALAIGLLTFFAIVRWMSPYKRRLPPGPTPIPFLGNVFGIKADAPWVSYTKMRETYGDIVYTSALGMDIVVLNSEEVANELLEGRSRIYSDRPYISTRDLFGWEWATPFLRYGERFKTHRRLFHQVFRPEAVLSYRPKQLQKAFEMLSRLFHDPTGYAGHFESFSASVVMSVVYDYDIASHDDVIINAAKRTMDLFLRVATPQKTALFAAFPFLMKLPSWVPGLGLKDAILSKRYVKDMLDMPYDYVIRNRADGDARACMVSDALECYQDTDNRDVVTEIKASAATVYGGAVETTSSSLIVFTLAMMNNPEVQERAQSEIDNIVGFDRLPNFDDLPALPYVGALIREVKRWRPITPLAGPHSNMEDDFYRGYFIPKGATIVPNTWAMAHNPKKYPEPESFCPDRFLNRDGSLNDDAIPWIFGFGRRRCPGREIADASLWCAITCILATFTIKKPAGPAPEIKWVSGLTSYPLPFPCRFVPRKAQDVQGLTRLIQSSLP
ncbi:cytochrome P450 [Rhizopogon vinicolor AM-OR11-026]|uniref:Cytochrome P450 n=1 Tax=Rhizopogon vinicolor AM-OR11-026 TaxID=1314800 RepID=A0A1B7MQX0_9AGAM|nr:cytochrome P450 [Rhizopogon vinicolor AM-OR11-026]